MHYPVTASTHSLRDHLIEHLTGCLRVHLGACNWHFISHACILPHTLPLGSSAEQQDAWSSQSRLEADMNIKRHAQTAFQCRRHFRDHNADPASMGEIGDSQRKQSAPEMGTSRTSMILLRRPCMISKPLSLLQITAASRRSLRAPLSVLSSSRITSDASKSRTGRGVSLFAPKVLRAPAHSYLLAQVHVKLSGTSRPVIHVCLVAFIPSGESQLLAMNQTLQCFARLSRGARRTRQEGRPAHFKLCCGRVADAGSSVAIVWSLHVAKVLGV